MEERDPEGQIQMKKILDVLYIAVFFSALLIPLFRSNTEKNYVSDFDNRELVEYPEVGQEDYEKKVEAYLRDRIGFRDQFVAGYQWINDVVAGELTHPLYTYGRNGYTFFNMHNNITYSSYHKLFAASVVKMKDYCEARGIPFYFMFDPEKNAVYRQYLPEGVNYNDDWVDELMSELRAQGVTVIDNREMLMRISVREQVYNRQYDAGHWNDLGAFYATNNLLFEVRKDFPAVTAYEPEDFTVETVVAKYLPNSKFSVNEEVPKYTSKTEYEDLTADYAAIRRDTRYPFFRYIVNTSEDAAKYPKMLVFHGSYYNRNPEFFYGRAKEYIGIHNYQNVFDLDYYFTLFQPDMIVFEVTEYTIDEQYFDYQQMTTMDYNPGLPEGILTDRGQTGGEPEAIAESVYVVSNPDFDEIYYENETGDAKYVYLAVEGKVYDLHAFDGIYSADVVHDSVSGSGLLVYVDYSDEVHRVPVRIRGVEKFERSFPVCSAGVLSERDGASYTFSTSEDGNVFNAVNVQLLEYSTGEYLETLDDANLVGARDASFVHKRKSGWYRIRLKANSTQRDEFVDILALLTQGRKYRFRYTVKTLEPGKVCIEGYEFFGGSKWTIEPQELVSEPQCTGGIAVENGEWIITTSVPGNRFGSVVLNLIDAATGEQIGPIGISDAPGGKKGTYYHAAPSGEYYIKLRGDTNLADEYILTSAVLLEGMLYNWSFDVISISPEEVRVRNLSFVSLGKEIE